MYDVSAGNDETQYKRVYQCCYIACDLNGWRNDKNSIFRYTRQTAGLDGNTQR